MKELSKKKKEILKKLEQGKISTINAKELINSIEEKENAKLIEK